MKDKEIYLSDLRSLKENISNKIMEAIQDLEAKNLKKIEKKIEKASQKIALGLIKASLKNAELLTKKLTQTNVSSTPVKQPDTSPIKRRGRPSATKVKKDLLGFESTTLKTILANKNTGLKRRGRPAKDQNLGSSEKIKVKTPPVIEGTPKKRGRPFGIKPQNNFPINTTSSPILKGKRGRPKVSKDSAIEKEATVKSIDSSKKRGRPRVIANKEQELLKAKSPLKPGKGRTSKRINSTAALIPKVETLDLNSNKITDFPEVEIGNKPVKTSSSPRRGRGKAKVRE
jgi:hypothetical protein